MTLRRQRPRRSYRRPMNVWPADSLKTPREILGLEGQVNFPGSRRRAPSAGFRLTPGKRRGYASARNPPPNPRRTGVPLGRLSHHGPPGHRDSFVPAFL